MTTISDVFHKRDILVRTPSKSTPSLNLGLRKHKRQQKQSSRIRKL